jgi:hypothetical protein
MSSADFSVPGNFSSSEAPAGNEIILLNELLANAMKKAMDAAGIRIITRCEPLPRMNGDASQMKLFCETLASMITKSFSSCSRAFLLVKCQEWNLPDNTNGSNQNKNYLLSFHTNLSEGFVGKAHNKEMISLCQRIISSHDGSFMVNNNNTGCLFSIILPGKLQ